MDTNSHGTVGEQELRARLRTAQWRAIDLAKERDTLAIRVAVLEAAANARLIAAAPAPPSLPLPVRS
jgi:hypothetical protein